MDVGGLCDHSCDGLFLLALVMVVASFCFFIAMSVPIAVNGQGIRCRLFAEQPASL